MLCFLLRCKEPLAGEGANGGGKRGQGVRSERTEELAGGDGDVAGEGFHAGFSG